MWKDAYLESRVLTADPIELIRILYEHAQRLVEEARQSLAAGDIAARSKSISRTIAILSELDGSLDHEVGGSISRNLSELYNYMRQRLLTANLKQEDAPLAEVESLLKTLAEAWQGIQPAATPVAPVEPVETPAGAPYGQNFGQFPQEPEVVGAAHGWSA